MALALTLVACHKHTPPPLALEECDPAGFIACIQQSAFASIPITDTNLFLTYSSRWRRHSDPGAWAADALGLGGWSLNLLQRYDPANRILMNGDGTWRIVDAGTLPSGDFAIPSFDGNVAFIFDSAGRHLRTVDGHLGFELLKITYDNAGRLSQVKGSLNGQPIDVSVQRDSSGAPQTLVGIDGATTRVTVDGNGHLTTVMNPAGETTETKWNSASLLESETDPAGGVQTFTYDSSGNLASATDADGVTQRYGRKTSRDSLEIQLSTPLTRTRTYRAEVTRAGIRRTLIAPDGTETDQTTDSHGNRTIQLADGTKWSAAVQTSPVWGTASPVLSPVVETRPDGVTSRREVEYSFRPQQVQQGLPFVLAGSVTTRINGQPWTQHFDPTEHSVYLVDPTGRRTILHYDEHGRLQSYSAPGAALVSYSYNPDARIVSETVGTGNLARTTYYSYDANTGQIITTRADGVIEKMMVDKAGRTVAASAGDGSTVVFGYNEGGRPNQVQPPGGFNFTLGTSAAGRSTAFAPPMVEGDGSIEISSYNKDGQLSAITTGNRAISYDYDSAGRVTSSTFGQGKGSRSYDSHSGFVNRASDPCGVTTSYGYIGSALTSLTWSGPVSGSVSVALDANGRPARESVNGGRNLELIYDPAGNLTGIGPLSLTRDQASGLVTQTLLGVVKTQQQFDENHELIRATTTAAGKVLLDLRYTRDALGRIKSVVETTSDGKNSTTEYSYDRGDRLASVRLNGRVAETNNYDPAGNRVRIVRADRKLVASYDDRNRIKNLGVTRYTWMPDGSLAGVARDGRATAFVYDDFGALRQASLPDGRNVSYIVDADGRRVGRELGGKLVAGYLYGTDGALAAETDATGKIVSRFGYDDLGRVALLERNGASYRVVTDGVGSPRIIIDSQTGSVAEQIAYDAWGNIMQDTSPGFIPIGFAGGLRDSDTGLIRFGARDYDPVAGRWTASDPIRFNAGDANLYRYAAADPVNLSDPTGLNAGQGGGQGVTPLLPPIPGGWHGMGSNPPASNPAPNNNLPLGGPSFWPGWLPPPPVQLQPINYGQGSGSGDGSQPGSGSGGGTGTGRGEAGSGIPNWGCQGIWCKGSGGRDDQYSPGCLMGSCHDNQYGFTCNAVICAPPNGPACFWCSTSEGEPHATSAAGLHFDFQAIGEFLIAKSPDGEHMIQARQQPYLPGAAVTVSTAVAADVNGDRIGVYINEAAFLLMNGVPIGDLDVQRGLPHGGKLQRHGGEVLIIWPDGSHLSITRVADSLSYAFEPETHGRTEFSGLLGSANGAPNKIAARDGSTLSISDPDFVNKLYKQVGNSWRIKQSESLFHYWPGESTAKFTDLNFPPKYVSVGSLSTADRSEAESICRAVGVRTEPLLDDCILDVGVTGMPAFAAASVGVRLPKASGAPVATSYQPAPAAPTSADHYFINIGDAVSPGHPAEGAGVIHALGQKQYYSFGGKAGELIYLGVGPCEGAQPNFDLFDPSNNLLANVIGNCHADIGRQKLPVTGTYSIITSTDKANINSRYDFFLHTIPPDQHFSVRLPLTVAPGSPALSAGRITAEGAQQFYDFSAPAGVTVHIEGKCVTASCPNLAIRASGVADDSARFFDFNYLTNDWKLPAGGEYTIQVRSNGYVGPYSFTASAATPENH